MIRCVDVRTELAPRVKVVAESRSWTAVAAAHGQLSGRRLTQVRAHRSRVDAQSRRAATGVRTDGEHVGIVSLQTSTSHDTMVSRRPLASVVGCLTDDTRTTGTTGAARAEGRSRAPDATSSRWSQMSGVGNGVGVDRRNTWLGRLDPVVDASSDTLRAKVADVVKVRVELRAHGLLEGVLGNPRLRQLLVHASNLNLGSLKLLLETQHLSQIGLRDVVELRVGAGSGGVRVGKGIRAGRVWRCLTTTLSVQGSALLAEKDLLLRKLGQEFIEVRVAGRKGLRGIKAEAVGRHRHGGHSDWALLMETQVSIPS